MTTHISHLQTPEPIYRHPNHAHWQTGEAAVECSIDATQSVYAVTEHYILCLYGRVDYRNFNEDYPYHGEILPLPEGLDDGHFTLYRQPIKKTATQLQRGDVIMDASGQHQTINAISPLRHYTPSSIHALQCGQTMTHWQHWVFTRLLRLKKRNGFRRA